MKSKDSIVKYILFCLIGIWPLLVSGQVRYPALDSVLSVADSIVYDDPESSLILAKLVEDRAILTDDDSLLAEALYRKGSAYWSKGDLSLALDELLYAEELLGKAGNIRLEANINRRIGTLYGGVEDHQTSIFYAKMAIDGFLKVEDKIGLIGSYNNIGNSLREIGQYDSARFYFELALDLLGGEVSFIEPILNFNLGEVYYEAGQLEKSLPYLALCKQQSERRKDKRGIIRSNQLIAEVLLSRGEFEDAQQLATEAFVLAQTTHSKELIYISARTLSNTAYATRDFARATRLQDLSRIYEDSIQSIANQNRMDFYRLAKAENELIMLKNQKEIDDLQAQNLKVWTVAIGMIAGLAILISLIFYRGRRFEKRAKAKLEEKNHMIEEQSQELTKLSDLKTRLLAVVTHDLKSPIQGLFGILDLLEKKLASPDELQFLMPDLKHRLTDTYSKINDLLNWSSHDIESTLNGDQTFCIKSCIESAVADLSSEANRKKIFLHSDLDPRFEANGDQKVLKTILRNLISNAIKFSPEGGTINLHMSNGNSKVRIGIKDDGVGIPEEKIGTLFTTKKEPTLGTRGEMGSGVGLIICHDLIKLLRGTIWVESTEGHGSEFFLSLPLAKG